MQELNQLDEESASLAMIVETHKAQDESFFVTGVESEEFEAALLHYCQTD